MCKNVNNKEQDNRTYKMNDTKQNNVKQEKDIRVMVDDQLKFDNHMYGKPKKANNIMGDLFIYIPERRNVLETL